MKKTKIALGVSSSIGLYKACEIVRGFQKAGIEVQVVMTPNAARLISPLLFSSLAGTKTIVDTFDEPEERSIRHIALVKEIALLCVAPATANVIGKFAGGVADDFLSTLFLAATAPVLIAPAMNEAMYLDRTTQDNMARLKALGAEFVEAEKGYLACGDTGWGRLAEPEAIVREGLRILARTASLAGRTVLVTAGPTREHLDPVRFLSNPSSGKMGYELAREAVARGARTILVSGPTALVPPAGARTEMVVTAAEMEKACLKAFPKADIVVMAAAVSDFRFKDPRGRKAAKDEIGPSLAIERTPDILARLGRTKKRGQVLVGFAAETHDIAAHARRKMAAKKADLMVANAVGDGRAFGTDTNEVRIIDPSGAAQATGLLSKREVSRIIFDRIEALLEKKSAADLREDLKAHVDFLAEAGAGFVLRRPGEEARREPSRPAPEAPSRAAGRPAAAPAAPAPRREIKPQPAPAPTLGPSLPSLAGWPPQTDAERAALEEIDGQVRACTRCALHRFRTNAVPGEGNRSAELMFIGEGPGRDEDLQGRPFIGRAGQLLRKIIAAMTFREDEVYITNMVKCRPPENRVPHAEETEACSPYLTRQIELIRPKVIVTLGRTPTDYFAPGREGMTARRGRFGEYRGIPVMPTFHPSYLVRNEGNRELKRMVWEDMQKVMALVGRK